MKKLVALALVVLGLGANVVACGCSARRTVAQKPETNQNK